MRPWPLEGRGAFDFWLRFGSGTGPRYARSCAGHFVGMVEELAKGRCGHAPLAKAWPKVKIPRAASLHNFCQCSNTVESAEHRTAEPCHWSEQPPRCEVRESRTSAARFSCSGVTGIPHKKRTLRDPWCLQPKSLAAPSTAIHERASTGSARFTSLFTIIKIARFSPRIVHIDRMVLTTVENAAGSNGHLRVALRSCVSSSYIDCQGD
jgi:hypothetical protein